MRNLGLFSAYVSLIALGCSDDAAVNDGSAAATYGTALAGIASETSFGGAATYCATPIGGGGIGGTGGAGVAGSKTTIFMEAEVLPVADVSAGDNQYILNGADYSNSQSRWLKADAAGDFITYGPICYHRNLLGPVWDIQLRTAKTPLAGKIRLAYGPSSTGPWYDLLAPLDLFSGTTGLSTSDLGGIVFQDSPTFIKFAVVGKNAASRGYNVNVDWVSFQLTQ